MTDMHAPGTEAGTAAAARRFGRRTVRSELTSLLPNPLSRPLGWVLLLGAVPVAGAIWSWLTPLPLPAAVTVSYVSAVAVITVLWMVIAPVVEARAFAKADYRWLREDGSGRAGAFAHRDRRGRLTVSSVWAEPRGRGLGGELMGRILTDTAVSGDLWLVAVNRRVATFYRRHGFRPVRRELLGHRMVYRRAKVGADDGSDQPSVG